MFCDSVSSCSILVYASHLRLAILPIFSQSILHPLHSYMCCSTFLSSQSLTAQLSLNNFLAFIRSLLLLFLFPFSQSRYFSSVSCFLFLSLYNAFLKRYDFSGVGFLVDRCKEAPCQDTAVAAALWISVPRLLTQRPASQSSQLKSHFLSRKK